MDGSAWGEEDNRTESDISRFVAEYWHQDHLGNTRLAFADFNEDSFIEIKDNPGTGEDELEITQEAHYYPFGMGHLGPWYATVAPENRYLYNGKEWNEDYGANLYEYGARWYDPVLGRFTGVDPIADQFPWVSTYNYAENEPVGNIDLWGLQKVLAVTQIGKNSNGENFIIQSSEVAKPSKGNHNHLYSVYSDPEKYGERGRLEIVHNVDTGAKLEKYELSFSEKIANFFDGFESPEGGIEFTLSYGQGKETRTNPNSELGPNLDDLLDAFGGFKSLEGVPVKSVEDALNYLLNSAQHAATVSEIIQGGNEYSPEAGNNDSLICPACKSLQDSSHIDHINGKGTFQKIKEDEKD